MRPRTNLEGHNSNTLVVTGPDAASPRYWLAVCTICKLEASYRADRLKSSSAACRCVDKRIHHNDSGTHLYGLWQSIKTRVRLQSYKYPLELEPEWAGPHDYTRFRDYVLSTIGRRPSSEWSLDRTNPFGGYVRGNIRWATDVEQANNRSTNNLIESPEYRHELTAWEWSRVLNQITGTEDWTRKKVLYLLKHLSIEQIISAVHPHRMTAGELRRAADDHEFETAFDAQSERIIRDIVNLQPITSATAASLARVIPVEVEEV